MTPEQKTRITDLISLSEYVWAAHGDCLGADADFHDIAVELGLSTHVFTPIKEDLRAFKTADRTTGPDSYFARNRAVVAWSDGMLACPPCKPLPGSGGTDYTVNYAIKMEEPIIVVWPDGSMSSSSQGEPLAEVE